MQINEETSYCPKCGARTSGAVKIPIPVIQQSAPLPNLNPPKKPNSQNIAILIVVLIAVIVVVLAALYNPLTGGASSSNRTSSLATKTASEMILNQYDLGDSWYKRTPFHNWTYTLYEYVDWAYVYLEDNNGVGEVDIVLLKFATVEDARNAYNDQYNRFKDNYSLSSVGVGDQSFKFYSVGSSTDIHLLKGNVMVLLDIAYMSDYEDEQIAQKQANKIR